MSGRTLLSGHDPRLQPIADRRCRNPCSTTCASVSRRTRLPNQLAGVDWEMGTELGYLETLLAYWKDSFDWRAQEARFNAFEPTVTEVDGQRIHFLHAALTGTRRAAAAHLARLARFGHGVPRRARPALEPARARRRSRRRVPRGRAVAPGLRVLRSHVGARLAPAPHGAGVHADHGRPRLRPLRRAGRRLGIDRVAERRRPRPRARVRPAPQLHHRAATEGRAGSHPERAARSATRSSRSARPAPATRRSRARSRRPSATRSKTRRRACARGSSRSSPRGPTATATSNASSRRTSCSPTSPCTGRPRPPRRRRASTTRCDRPDARRSRTRTSACPPAWRTTRARSPARRGRGPSTATTSRTGPTNPTAGTSRRCRCPTSSWPTSGSSSAPSAEHGRRLACSARCTT